VKSDAPATERSAAFHLLLATLVAVFASLLGAPDSESGRSVTSALLAVSLGTALWAASRSARLRAAGLVVVAASAVGWFSELFGLPSGVVSVGPTLSAACLLGAVFALSPRVFWPRVVTEGTLVGTVCIYLLLSLAFACAYLSISELDSGAFTTREVGGEHLADFAYLSLVTMTTLGYGDIAPVSGPARALAMAQATAGVLYSAIAVARLVAVHAAGGSPRASEDAVPWHRQHFGILFIALALGVLLPVALEQTGGSTLRQTLSAFLLLAALYGLSGQRMARIAAGPVMLSVALRAWSGSAPGSPAEVLVVAMEVCVFGAGLGVVARRVLYLEKVNREVLFGASSLYILLGVWVTAAFDLVSELDPGALAPPGPHSVGDLLYLSFMTITTTGYGDIVPTSRATEVLSGLAACLGIFYPAILVARLVSLSSQRDA
jgi:hypothetical protein